MRCHFLAPFFKKILRKKAVHEGVGCDGCFDLPIKGPRYNCMVCKDYDLCEKCYKKGIHDSHPVQKLSKPAEVCNFKAAFTNMFSILPYLAIQYQYSNYFSTKTDYFSG